MSQPNELAARILGAFAQGISLSKGQDSNGITREILLALKSANLEIVDRLHLDEIERIVKSMSLQDLVRFAGKPTPDPSLPPSLRVTPNIPLARQTDEQLLLERDYWVKKLSTVSGPASGAATVEFLNDCEREIRRRGLDAKPSGVTEGPEIPVPPSPDQPT